MKRSFRRRTGENQTYQLFVNCHFIRRDGALGQKPCFVRLGVQVGKQGTDPFCEPVPVGCRIFCGKRLNFIDQVGDCAEFFGKVRTNALSFCQAW